MKRFFFSLIALSAAAVGCTQSAMLETPDLGGTAISFSPYTGRTPVTKAQEIVGPGGVQNVYGLAEADGFYAYCFLDKKDGNAPIPYIDNAKVTSTDGALWSYQNTVYWPDSESESTLSFVAYSANAGGKYTTANDTQANLIEWLIPREEFKFTVPSDIDEQIDLLATSYLPDRKYADVNSDGNIILTFYHLLSKVGFQVQTTSNKSVTIKELSFSGMMQSQGIINLKSAQNDQTPKLQATGNKALQQYIYVTDGAIPVSNAQSSAKRIPRSGSEYMMIMPHTIGQNDDHTIQVTYRIDGSQVDKTTTVYLDPSFEFKAGRAYEFVLKISTSKITFNITETGWNDQSEATTTYPLSPMPQDAVTLGAANTITSKSAIIPVTVNHTDIYEVGVEYREQNSTEWNSVKVASNPDTKTYTVTLEENIESAKTYEYRAYAKADEESETVYYPGSSYPSFTTNAEVSVEVSEVTQNSAKLTGICSDDNITERGFYWVGYHTSGVPSETDNKVVIAAGQNFETTLSGLNAGSQYTCWAYVKINNITYFSPAQEINTKFMVGDDTGADWGDGGNTEI